MVDVPDPRGEASAVVDDLAKRALLIVSGKGGVGRTAVSALLGLELARRGRKVLVATVGHDDRLAWMLGQQTLADTAVEIAPRLHVQRVVPHVCVREYGSMMMRSERISRAVFDNKLMRRVMGALPGLDDYAILGKLWHVACRAREYDCVVYDGPATGHLRYNLQVPSAILETVPRGPLIKDAKAMHEALIDPRRVAAVLVGLPARWPLTELGELATSLREELHVSIGALIVNGLWPINVPLLPEPPRDDPDGALERFFAITNTIAAQARRQETNVSAWLAEEQRLGRATPPVIELPWRWAGIAGLADLQALADALREGRTRA
ncbi:MAG: ArsA family ATPase [Nannocystaceae bacterium]|nr:ArsA family ATPase [Myxococcales bacterium]